MYGKYLRVLLLAVRRIWMPVSALHIFYHRSTYVYIYVDTDELRRGSFSLLNSSLEYIAKWRFVARSFRDNQPFKNPQILDYFNK